MELSLPPLPGPLAANGVHHPSKPPPPLAAGVPGPVPSVPQVNPLEQELPTVSADLVPLSYLIDRLVTQSYSDFSTLLETLPSHTDQQRKQLLVDYVLHTRRQFLKLLVLTRWSAESDRIRKSINIIGFLSNQNHQLDASIQQLTQAVEGLKGARVRNYDLETSLTVLQKGTYDRLPSAIREAFEGQEKLDDDQVIDTMRECEQVMRWRLKMGKEEIPRVMLDNYRIADGRVTFTIEGLWEASFVYSGTETQDAPSSEPANEEEGDAAAKAAIEDQSEWYLLGVKFLFTVRDERGGSWNPTPTGPLKQHLVDLCNAQLARRPFLPPPPPAPLPPPPSADPAENKAAEDAEKDRLSEVEAKHESAVKEARSKRRRDQPLQRGYTFLQRLALSYQLESIYAQAVQLIRSDWNACGLRVEMNGERDQVKLRYWNDTEASTRNSSQQPASSSTPPQSPGGTLIFSVSALPPPPDVPPRSASIPSNPKASQSTRSHLNERATSDRRRKALESLLNRSRSTSGPSSTPEGTNTDDTPLAKPEYPPTSLQVTFVPSSTSSAVSISPEVATRRGTRDNLDVEEILTRVVNLHAAETLAVVAKELGISEEADERGTGPRIVYPPTSRTTEQRSPDRGSSNREATGEGAVDDGGEEDEEAGRVPHLVVPLVGQYALTVHVEAKSGRVELRSASTTAMDATEESGLATGIAGMASGDGEGGGSREARLRSATDRLNSSRFTSGENNPDAWIKSLPEVIAKIRATTVLDEISTLFNLLSLPTLRRLPLPPRELSKFGPLPSLALGRPTFLFVPLNAHCKGEGLEGFYLGIVAMEDGVRMSLVGTRECTEESSGSTWVEITEVGWIYRDSCDVGRDAKGKEREVDFDDRSSNFGNEVSAETLRKVWNYCVHRILVYRLEQQLHSRQISYRSSSATSSRLSIDLEPPPFLILDTSGLTRLPHGREATSGRAKGDRQLLLRTAALRCHVDDETHSVQTSLQIRIDPAYPRSSLPPPFSSSQSDIETVKSQMKLPRNVYYNPATRALVFLTENEVLGAVERILKAYAVMMEEIRLGIARAEQQGKGKGDGER